MSSGLGDALGLGLAASEADGAVDAGADGDGLVAAGVQAPTTIITEATRLRPLRVRRLIVLLLIASSGNVSARSSHGRNTDTVPGPASCGQAKLPTGREAAALSAARSNGVKQIT